jgi:hypothetical protein
VISLCPLSFRSLARAGAVIVVVATLATPAGADVGDPSAAAIGGPAFTRLLSARLTGSAEVDAAGNPDQGDLDGVGLVSVVVEQGNSAAGHPAVGTDLCVRIVVAGIDTPTAAHIHQGAEGVNGPIVVPLPTPVDGTSQGCVPVDDIQLQSEISGSPSPFYVNVHTAAFPNGAVRGQLTAAGATSPMQTSLSGAAVLDSSGASGAGDADGVGQAEVLVDPGGIICIATNLSGIDAPTAIEVDTAPFTANGPILLTSSGVPGLGTTGRCSPVAAAAVAALLADPTGHAVVVRTAAHPLGALRGQIRYGLTSMHATAASGRIWSYGEATDLGSTADRALTRPIVGIAATPTTRGYWLVASDGGIFSFGDASFFGSTGAITLNQPIVGMAATPTGRGYWLVAADGGIFSFGDATFLGSTGAITLRQPIVGMGASPSGLGYRMVARDGGVFSFGDAPFLGSGAATFREDDPYVGMLTLPMGQGYRLVTASGQGPMFGDGAHLGNIPFPALPLDSPLVGVAL